MKPPRRTTSASDLIARYATTKGCRTIPLQAKDICCNFIQRYAEEAQTLSQEYRQKGDRHNARLLHHISISAFAVVRGESDKIHHRGADLEFDTRKYMLRRITEALETLQDDYESLTMLISARHTLRKPLQQIEPHLSTAIKSFGTAYRDLLASINHAEAQMKETTK